MCRRSSKSFHRSSFLVISRSARPSDGLTSHCHARRGSPRTFSVISPLGSPLDAAHLAHFRSFHRSARRSTRLTSHIFGHFTARLAARRGSPRTAITFLSQIGADHGRVAAHLVGLAVGDLLPH